MPQNREPGSLPLSDAERKLLNDPEHTNRQVRLDDLLQKLEFTSATANNNHLNAETALTRLEIAGLQLDLDDRDSAWHQAHAVIDFFINNQRFEDAALAAQYIYLCDKEDSISAIGQAAWLSVTYPVDPHLTINILDHIVDETPDESDGAAVAAATAHYVADLRANDQNREQLKLASGAMLARVAKRHSKIEDQQQFALWVRTLELDEPAKFLVRLRNVIDVMVQTDWWFDREQLATQLPDDAGEHSSPGADQ